FPVPSELRHALDWDYLLARDISVVGGRRVQMHILNLEPLPPTILEFESSDAWVALHSEVGVRSILRTPTSEWRSTQASEDSNSRIVGGSGSRLRMCIWTRRPPTTEMSRASR